MVNYFKLLNILPYDGVAQVFKGHKDGEGGTKVETNARPNRRATRPRAKGHFKQ